jgi:GTPase SAR1 family protein
VDININAHESELLWLKESVCVILLYDVTRQDTFHNATGRLLEETRRYVSDSWSFFMLIGNKMDIEDARQVETEEAQDCA